MIRHRLLRLFSLFTVVFLCVWAQAETHTQLSVTPLAPLEVSSGQGVAAAYAGVADGQVLLAGGANFPDVPVQLGGRKVFYDDVWRMGADGTWQRHGQLSGKVASGASVSVADGIICVGGTDGEHCLAKAFLLGKDGREKTLPALPFGIQQHALAVQGDVLYLVGGTTDEEANRNVYKLDYKNDTEWSAVTELPDASRLQCVAAVQTGNTAPCLYVFGGYTEADPKADGRTHVLTDGLCLNLKTLQWTRTAPLPEEANVTGGTCAKSGYSHILFFGGINKDVFEARVNDPRPDSTYFLHEPAWYRFNSRVLVYHTITNSWFTLSENERFARAGAGLVTLPDGGWLYVNGEVKPGVRSTDVTRISLESEKSFGWLNWVVLAAYLLGMLGLGYYFMRREGGADDFFKGGGRIPWWAAGISIYATMISALTYMGIPAKAYATNWTYYPILVTIVLVSIPVIKYYLPYFRKLNITSAYEYLEIRFNAATRLMASALFIVFMVARMALVLYIPSLALSAVTGIDVQHCIILMSTVTILYCTMGGIEAVVWGDVIQGAILVGGALLLAGWLVFHTEGGVGGYLNIGASHDKFRLFEWSLDYRNVTFWVAIIGGFANNLISCTSDQTYIQRYLTTKDEKGAARSIWMNSILCVCIGIVFYIIGTGLYTFYQTHPSEVDITMSTGDAIVPYFMMSQMPQGVAGLLIAAIFAATMSTLSSNINSISTAFCIDFWKKLRPAVDDKSMVRVARVSGILAGGVGLCLALLMTTWNILSLVDYFNTILGLLTGGLGGLFFIGVFMPRVGGKAALGGFVCGTVFVFWMKCFTDANLFLYGASGLVVSALVAWILSLLLKGDAPKVKM